MQGTAADPYLKILNLTSSLTTQQKIDVANNKVDLLSFLHIAQYNNRPLIDGILAQQYSCQPANGNPCGKVNAGALPGSFSSDTPTFYDTTLPFALMSAHDDPPQLQIPSATPAPPWKSYYLSNNQALPFQSGVYWDEKAGNSDFMSFQPSNYLTPTPVSSMANARTSSGVR